MLCFLLRNIVLIKIGFLFLRNETQRSYIFTFYYNKMKQLTVRKTIMISEKQANNLKILESYNVNVSQFIRQAIKEKLHRDWKEIKDKKQLRIKNAPGWLYK